jgi:hypothetical protein
MSDTSAPIQRKHKRIQRSCKVEFCSNSHGEAYRGVSENFSVDGLFIRSDNLLPLKTAVSITVYLPDGATSKLEGSVRRVYTMSYDAAASEQAGMGIEIMKRDSNYMKFFLSLLSNCTK